MHDHFADWYRPCTVGTEANLTGDLLAKRWEGVEKVAEADGLGILDMARLALGRRGGSSAFLDKFRGAFKEVDATFQMTGNELELSVLAGTSLVWAFDQESIGADEAALALLCAVRFVDAPTWSAPFVSHANTYLGRRLQELRRVPKILRPQPPAKKVKQQFDAFAAKLAENNPAQTSEAARQLADALLQAMTTAAETTAEAVADLERQSSLRREETDVLWWLTSGVSRNLGKPFTKLKTPAACLVAGIELADLVSPPGILPAESILQSIIPPAAGKASGKPVAIQAAVNATPVAWREDVIKDFAVGPIADLCPVLTAIKHSLTTDEPEGWASAYKKATGVDAKVALPPVELAHQIHRERLLVRLAAE